MNMMIKNSIISNLIVIEYEYLIKCEYDRKYSHISIFAEKGRTNKERSIRIIPYLFIYIRE